MAVRPPARTRAKPSTRVLALFVCLLLLATQASGQEEEAPPAPPPLRAIETSSILGAAQDAEAELQSVLRLMRFNESLESVQAELPSLGELVDRQARRQTQVLEHPTLRNVEELQSDWLALREELPGWRESLEVRAAEIQRTAARMDKLETVWAKTLAAAREDDAPEAILSRARAVLEQVRAADRQISERRAEVLTLQAAVSNRIAGIDGSLELLEDLRGQLVRRVLERDRAPIWDADLRSGFTEDVTQRVGATIAKEGDEVRSFIEDQGDQIPIHLAMLVVLIALLWNARGRVRRRTEEEVGLSRVADVFEFPVSMSLLLWILVAPWMYGVIPTSVGQILGAVALIPTVVILRRFTPKSLHPLLAALVVFYFVDRIRELLDVLPVVSRVIFLFEMLAAAIFLALLLRPSRIAEIPQWAARSRLLRVLGMATTVSLGVFSLALVAELTGYSRLGHLLGGGALESAYVAVVAYASVQIGSSLVTLALRVRPLGRMRMVQRSRDVIRGRALRAITVAAGLIWAALTLDLFALWSPLTEAVVSIARAEANVGSLAFSLGDPIAFGATIYAAFLISKFIRFVLEEDVYSRLNLGRGVPYAVSTFLHYGILLIGFVIAVAAMGIDLDRFTLLAGAFGVGIGFGLQNVVNNFVSGLILLTERPIQVGDTIDAGDALGEVTRIGIRSSTVRTWSGAELIVPNAQLISERVTNWTLSDHQRRVDVPVGVAYGTNREMILEILQKVADENESVIADPPPVALFIGFGDSSLDFELRAWTSNLKRIMVVRSELAMAIGDALDEAGVEIPFPQRDLHVRSLPPAAAGEGD